MVRPVQKVGGGFYERKRYGEIKTCQDCGDEFFTMSAQAGDVCSNRCAGVTTKTKAHTAKGQKLACDKLFSKAVRAKGVCERCGTQDYSKLQCAHIISRSYLATRWSFENAFCLCAGCHYWGHKNPLEWDDFVVSKIGEEKYQELKVHARRGWQPDYPVLKERLQVLLEMEEEKYAGSRAGTDRPEGPGGVGEAVALDAAAGAT